MTQQVTTPEAVDFLRHGAVALSSVENNGIRVNVPYLESTITEVSQRIVDAEQAVRSDSLFNEWRKLYGIKTKLANEQLANLVFDKLGYECPSSTETGRNKSDEAAFQKVDLPIVKNFFTLQKLKNMRTRYLIGLRREIVDGYYHPEFHLHTASTFRSSAGADKESGTRGYNFQNLPIRNSELAKLIRECFIPREKRRIVEIDYSTLEVRTGAFYHHDPVLIRDVIDGDMHRDTACELFFLKPDQVDKKTTRDWAKNRFVFAQFYGDVYYHCAEYIWRVVSEGDKHKLPNSDVSVLDHLKKNGITGLGVEMVLDKQKNKMVLASEPRPGTFGHHCKKVEDSFWLKRFKVYGQWRRDWHAEYKRVGGFRMLTGFWISGINGMSRNEVICTPIQGVAFHCLLYTIIELVKWLQRHKMKSVVIGEIHDSVILDVVDKELDDVLYAAKWIMTEKITKAWNWVDVPLAVEAEATPIDGSWHHKAKVII